MVDARWKRKYHDEGHSGADLDAVCQDGSMVTNLMKWAWSKSLEQPVLCRIDPTMSRPRTQDRERLRSLVAWHGLGCRLSYIIGFLGDTLFTPTPTRNRQFPCCGRKNPRKRLTACFTLCLFLVAVYAGSRVGKGTGAISGYSSFLGLRGEKSFFILVLVLTEDTHEYWFA